MSLPIVQAGLFDGKNASMSDDPIENTKRIIEKMKETQPQLIAVLMTAQQQMLEGDRSEEYTSGFFAGACCFFELLQSQAECDDLSGQ